MDTNIITDLDNKPPDALQNHTPILYKRDVIPLPVLIPKVEKNKFFYENGLSNIIPRLRLKVVSDPLDCEELWDKFKYNDSIFDLWEVRKSFWQAYQYPLYFYTLYEGKKPIGVLPLHYDTDIKVFNWFGGGYPEDNKFFIHDSKIINILLKILPRPVKLRGIIPVEKEDLYVDPFEYDDAKNIKYLTTFSTIDDYIAKLSKKIRYNLKRDIKRINSLETRVYVEKPSEKLVSDMVELLRVRFADDESSKRWLFDPKFVETFNILIANSGAYKVEFIRVMIKDKLAGLDMLLSYKDTVYSLGANASYLFSGVGNYMTYLNVKYAIERGFTKLDYFQEDYGYKHRYFDQYPVWKIVMK